MQYHIANLKIMWKCTHWFQNSTFHKSSQKKTKVGLGLLVNNSSFLWPQTTANETTVKRQWVIHYVLDGIFFCWKLGPWFCVWPEPPFQDFTASGKVDWSGENGLVYPIHLFHSYMGSHENHCFGKNYIDISGWIPYHMLAQAPVFAPHLTWPPFLTSLPSPLLPLPAFPPQLQDGVSPLHRTTA